MSTSSHVKSKRFPGGRFTSERGQVLVLMAVGMVAVLAMAGFAIDVSAAYHTHRRAQAAADASAMAAAEYLPGSTGQADSASSSVTAENLSDGTVTTAYSATYTSNDTVTSTAKSSSPSVFAKVLGISTFDATAKATVVVGSYLGWANDIAPWAVAQSNITWGDTRQFAVESGDQPSAGNFGHMSLPINEDTCNLGEGKDYYYLIADKEHSCLVQVGDKLLTQSGIQTGQTKQGLDDRGVIQDFDPYSILKQLSDGSYVLTTYKHPNLVVIPVIDKFSNSSVTVVGFAWFIITKYTKKTVTGMFISSQAPSGAKCPTASDPNAACPVGGYNPYGFKVIRLTQ